MFGKVYESRRIRAIEENAQWLGMPTILMMENAGKCVAEFIRRTFGEFNEKIIVVAGKGGNAGDGFAASRHLASMGYKVALVTLFSEEQITHEDAKRNFMLLRKIEGDKLNILSYEHLPSLTRENAKLIVDAILGTGVRGELREPIAGAIELMNSSSLPIVSIDIPSGIDPDTGIPATHDGKPTAVRASYTITMHFLKPGLLKDKEYSGNIEICNIGIPDEAEIIVGPGDVRNFLARKPKDAKKGDGGVVSVIGGSIEYSGAPSLASLAALASGADLVFTIVPSSIKQIVASFSPSIIAVGVGEHYFSPENADFVMNFVRRSSAAVIGPGMGYNKSTCSFTKEIIERMRSEQSLRAIVVDADALKCISEYAPELDSRFVITPHRGELSLLLRGYRIAESEDRKKNASELSISSKSIVLSKGPIDYICFKGECREKRGGNPGMSIGGTGDVLAGLIASLSKRTPTPFHAACIASFINSYAGDKLFERYGEFFTSEMLVREIPGAISSMMDWR
ncbi:MAG: NAD(P)H-hydrate dehydratase [Fervidicoccaceae archaeon]